MASTTTKPKKAFIQTNTLFSYFDSTKPSKPEVKPKATNSILNYFKSDPGEKNEEDHSKPVSIPSPKKSTQSPLSDFKPQKRPATQTPLNDSKLQKRPATQSSLSNLMKIEPNCIKKELKPQLSLADFKQTNSKQLNDSTQIKNEKFNSRKCPFYKRVEGTQICVDAFSYGDIDNCNAYFLSHYHYDHFIGLKKDFKNQLYCSKITANLVMKNIKVDRKYITILDYNKFLNVYEDGSVHVALIDANQ